MRERFSSILAAVSIRSKPNSRFQVLRFSCISKRRICPSRCVASRSLTRIVSQRCQLVASISAIIFAESCSLTVILKKSGKKREYSRSPDLQSPTTSRNPGSLGFSGCALVALLRPVPPISLALSSQRSRPVSRPVILDVQYLPFSWCRRDRADEIPALGKWIQISTVTRFPGSSPWVLVLDTRSLLLCDRWFLTHWRYPQNALGR